jgi:cytochrome c peroxidase
MGFPDTACVAFRLSQAVYRPLFELLWGKDSLNIKFPPDTEKICATPGGATVFSGDPEPIKLRPEERTEAQTVYDHWVASLDAYEQSVQVSNFTSKFDAMLKGDYTFTPDEQAGYNTRMCPVEPERV